MQAPKTAAVTKNRNLHCLVTTGVAFETISNSNTSSSLEDLSLALGWLAAGSGRSLEALVLEWAAKESSNLISRSASPRLRLS
ncbi:hypothetical protein L596_010778 [Steinernema carpocapsae]|uniref:Uncharacterized protein n=1 Tax=Steinernema carpocapsae TaxID=34508 RepID=A0A4U5PLG0_STECR|nr:hypothetical protein L596_010778 [Steinernema carpocapsae]